jgi:hypothetical protein
MGGLVNREIWARALFARVLELNWFRGRPRILRRRAGGDEGIAHLRSN